MFVSFDLCPIFVERESFNLTNWTNWANWVNWADLVGGNSQNLVATELFSAIVGHLIAELVDSNEGGVIIGGEFGRIEDLEAEIFDF